MAGLALIAVNPLLVYVMPIADAARYGVYEAVGCTSMALGFLLLAPLAIVATEAAFGPWIARLVGLEPRLLRAQLSSNLWRTLGTTVALTVGLGLYVSMMVWGYSMLEPFKPGDWVPDMLVAFQSGGLPDTEIDAVRHVEGVIPEQCIPLAVEQPRLAADITGSREGNSVTRQDNVIMIGLDPQVAFGGPKPLIGAKFVAGTAEEAIAKLAGKKNEKGDGPHLPRSTLRAVPAKGDSPLCGPPLLHRARPFPRGDRPEAGRPIRSGPARAARQAGRVHDRRRGFVARLALDDQVLRPAPAKRPLGGDGFCILRRRPPRLRSQADQFLLDERRPELRRETSR